MDLTNGDLLSLSEAARAFARSLFDDHIVFPAQGVGNNTTLLYNIGPKICPISSASFLLAALISDGHLNLVRREGGAAQAQSMAASMLMALLNSEAMRRPQAAATLHGECPIHHTGRWHLPVAGHDCLTGALICPPRSPRLPCDPSYPLTRTVASGVHTDPRTRNLLTVLTPLIIGRAGLPEFPIILIDAPEKNSGKTRLAHALQALLGGGPRLNSFQRLGFALTGQAWQPGPTPILFDNLTHTVATPSISAAVHSEHLQIEPKYQALAPVYWPVFIMTTNSARVDNDLADKCLPIMLERPPTLAAGQPAMMDPDPLSFVQTNRAGLVSEAQAILLKAQVDNDTHTTQTRFVQWERAFQAVAAVLGIEVDLSEQAAPTKDRLFLELMALFDEYDVSPDRQTIGDPPAAKLVQLLRQNRDLQELNDWYSSRGFGGPVGGARGLVAMIRSRYGNRPLIYEGQCVTLDVEAGCPAPFPTRIVRKFKEVTP